MIVSILERLDKKMDAYGERLAAIEEHLKTLNGKVARNVKEIEETKKECVNRIIVLEKDSIDNKVKWAKLVGMMSATGTLSGILVGMIMRVI